MSLNARRSLALVASAALLAASGACTSGTSGANNGGAAPLDPGLTDNSIVLGVTTPLSGPAAAGYSKISAAAKAYFAYINAKFNGVNGRHIDYEIKDDGYNPATTNTVTRELVEQKNIFAMDNALGTPTHTNVVQYLNTKQVPDLFVASGSKTWNQPTKYPYTFGVQTDYTTEGKIFGSYIKANFAGKKVCFLGQNDDFGDDSLAGVEKGLGSSVVDKEQYAVATPNVGPQVGKLKAAGCEIVVLATIPPFTALTIGTAAALAFKPQWVVSGVGADYATVAASLKGDPNHLLDGMISDGYLPSVNAADDPWIKYFKSVNAAYNNNASWDGQVLYGMAVAWLTVQALTKAGKDLSRKSLISALESGTLTSGPGIVPLVFSTTDHSGWRGGRLSKVTGTDQEYFGDTYTTDAADAPVTVYNATPEAPPAFQA